MLAIFLLFNLLVCLLSWKRGGITEAHLSLRAIKDKLLNSRGYIHMLVAERFGCERWLSIAFCYGCEVWISTGFQSP